MSNSGTVNASGGLLKITGSISGSGSDTISNASTLEANGILVTQSLAFANSASNAAIQLDSVLLQYESFQINNWQKTDELIINNGSSVTNAQWLSGGSNIGTLAVTTGGTVYDFTSVTLADSGPTPQFSFSSDAVTLVSCFTPGTLIETALGPVPVECLTVGDAAVTAEGETEEIIWIGQRTINCAAHPHPDAVWPVRIEAGAFGAGSPVRDLWLSPDHAVFVDCLLYTSRCV